MADDNKTTEKKLTGAAAKAAAAKAEKEAVSGDQNPENTGGQPSPEAAVKGETKAKKPVAKTVTKKTPDNPTGDPAKAPKAEDKFEALAKRYAKAYPKCKAFHITSDGQVFLENDQDAARFHQNGIGTGELKTITMK